MKDCCLRIFLNSVAKSILYFVSLIIISSLKTLRVIFIDMIEGTAIQVNVTFLGRRFNSSSYSPLKGTGSLFILSISKKLLSYSLFTRVLKSLRLLILFPKENLVFLSPTGKDALVNLNRSSVSINLSSFLGNSGSFLL